MPSRSRISLSLIISDNATKKERLMPTASMRMGSRYSKLLNSLLLASSIAEQVVSSRKGEMSQMPTFPAIVLRHVGKCPRRSIAGNVGICDKVNNRMLSLTVSDKIGRNSNLPHNGTFALRFQCVVNDAEVVAANKLVAVHTGRMNSFYPEKGF